MGYEMAQDNNVDWEMLVAAAIKARELAYAPYSNFLVGAALLTADGTVFSGCNVENASYGLSLCAERTAIVSSVAAGNRDFVAIAVAATPLATPCGACRQFIAEFGLAIQVASVDVANPAQVSKWAIAELLPESFRLKQ